MIETRGNSLLDINIMDISFKRPKSWILTLIILPLLFSSCKDDEEVSVQYYLTCSEDVLEYLQPTVSYTDGNGNTVTKTLSRSDFSPSSDTRATSVDTSTDIIFSTPTWYTQITIDGDEAISHCQVTFSKLKDVPDDIPAFRYCAALVATATYKKGSSTSSSVNISLPIPIVLDTKAFGLRLDALTKEGLRQDVKVAANGEIQIK